MYNTMNEAEFAKLILANEECAPRNFNFNTWGERREKCGTVACLIGNYAMRYNYGDWEFNKTLNYFSVKPDIMCEKLGITYKEFEFLFMPLYYLSRNKGVSQRQHIGDKEGHLRRVRKFYWYKMKKAALFAEWYEFNRVGSKIERSAWENTEPQYLISVVEKQSIHAS
jgi:hypothetical protein